jgi:hypothetical protein
MPPYPEHGRIEGLTSSRRMRTGKIDMGERKWGRKSEARSGRNDSRRFEREGRKDRAAGFLGSGRIDLADMGRSSAAPVHEVCCTIDDSIRARDTPFLLGRGLQAMPRFGKRLLGGEGGEVGVELIEGG